MLKLEDHDRIAWVPVENLLRLFLNLE